MTPRLPIGSRPGRQIPRQAWIAAALVAAAALFWAATTDVVYEITSPPSWSWHVLLRKAYSVAAFAVVGSLAGRALGPSKRPVLRSTLVVAAYSATIESVQWLQGSKEGFGWNAFDIGCGGLGGWLAAAIDTAVRSRGLPVPRR